MSQGPPSPCALMLQRWDDEEWNACEVCEDAPEEPPVVGLSVLGKRKRSTCTAFLDNGKPCNKQAQNGGLCCKHGARRKKCSALLDNGKRCTNIAWKRGMCCKHGTRRKKCSALLDNGKPCNNQAQNGGLCSKHGARRKKCSALLDNGKPCTNGAVKGAVCCKHGAEQKKCSVFDNGKRCTNTAVRGGVCRKHGAPTVQCSAFLDNGEPCTYFAHKGGMCNTHGAPRPKCSALDNGEQCKNEAKNGGVCIKHGARYSENRLCKYNVETRCGVPISKATNRFDGACVRCFVRYNPNDPRSSEANKRAKVKEQSVVDFVKQHFGFISWTCDRSIRSAFNDNFALVRPDMRALLRSIDIDTHDLIVEVDEWKHEAPNYGGCKREDARIGAVWRNVSGGKRPLVVIRINPDDYVDPATGEIVTSCFAYSKAEAKVDVKPSKETEWQQRLEKLRQTISYWTIDGNVPDQELTTVQLFY